MTTSPKIKPGQRFTLDRKSIGLSVTEVIAVRLHNGLVYVHEAERNLEYPVDPEHLHPVVKPYKFF